MYKDFVNVTPESGGAGTTPIAVAADENEGAARSTSLNIAGGGVTRTASITQKKMLVENQMEEKQQTHQPFIKFLQTLTSKKF